MTTQELRKIFDIKRILLIFMLAVLFYLLFFQKNVGIPAYSSERVHLEVSLKLVKEYGNELEEIEYRELRNNFLYAKENNTEKSSIDMWIKENDVFSQYGIESYEDLITMQDSLPDDAAASMTSQVYMQFTGEERQAALDDIWRKSYIEILLESYNTETKSNQRTAYYPELPKKADKRVEERNRKEVYSLMPDNIMRKYLTILPDFAVFLFLSMIFFIVPYSVKDTMENVNVMQYVSKKGCNFYWRKVVSVFISAIILCVIEVALFILMLSKNDTFYFRNCFVSGFQNSFITFIKLTFGQYIVISLVYIIIIGLCLSIITYSLSSCAHNYISAIAFQIPMIIFSIVISLTLIPHFAEITQNITQLFIVLTICIFIAVVSSTVRFLSIKFYGHI